MPGSECCDVVEPGDCNDLRTADQDSCPVASDAESNGIMDINLARGRAIAEIMEIGVMQFQKLCITGNESPQADIR